MHGLKIDRSRVLAGPTYKSIQLTKVDYWRLSKRHRAEFEHTFTVSSCRIIPDQENVLKLQWQPPAAGFYYQQRTIGSVYQGKHTIKLIQ